MAERASPILEAHRFLRRGPVNAEGWSQLVAKDRDWERSYRGRWAHDKVVRSTHGVNCTGSCSWNVYVKDGLITWESQAVDYPSTGAGDAGVRAARLPARGVVLLVHVLAAAAEVPVRARQPAGDVPRGARRGWAIRSTRGRRSSTTRRRRALYKRQRGKGGFVRASWDEAVEMIAAAHVHTIKRYGPDRVVGLLADPGDVDGLLRGGHALPVADRRGDPVVLRLVRGPAAVLAADVRRPDRRAGVRRLVERRLPADLGHEPADDAHAGRALHDRGALPRPEGRRRLAGLRRAHEVRRPLAGGRAGHATARWRWRWAT